MSGLEGQDREIRARLAKQIATRLGGEQHQAHIVFAREVHQFERELYFENFTRIFNGQQRSIDFFLSLAYFFPDFGRRTNFPQRCRPHQALMNQLCSGGDYRLR
ncbi:hypothetical protein Csa_022715 [Cucumis sativus]|uniref:Uncharacterized protein n=1 Tax=Cucumis sativus TaxID=3659 RepID=A0A0A0LVL4_CUCSA|nr:hypothetical protein Csa_022715 [Cucumis sativus]